MTNNRPRGEWVHCTCSLCGHTTCDWRFEVDHSNGGSKLIDIMPNFCSNCGADMRKENTEKSYADYVVKETNNG